MRLAVLSAASVLAGMSVAFAAGEAPVQSTTNTAAAGIVVYDEPNFQGHALTLAQPTPDLSKLNFDDRVASLVINGGGDWVLCENRNYAGRCIRVATKAENLKLLQLNGRVSSLYPVPVSPAATAPAPTAKP